MRVTLLKHELRTPINHIIGYSEIMLEDLDEPAGRCIAGIRRTVGDLVVVIDALLSPARLNGAPFAPASVLNELRRAVHHAVDWITAFELMSEAFPHPTLDRRDLERIMAATARLEEFARTGSFRQLDTSQRRPL